MLFCERGTMGRVMVRKLLLQKADCFCGEIFIIQSSLFLFKARASNLQPALMFRNGLKQTDVIKLGIT